MEINRMNKKEINEEYLYLTRRLDIVNQGLEGYCDDVDCDKYVYKDVLKKDFKPTLDHSYSCIGTLVREKKALIRVLSLPRYKEDRYEKCPVCKVLMDKLDEKGVVLFMLTKPLKNGNSQIHIIRCHEKCKLKFKIPKGWKKDF